ERTPAQGNFNTKRQLVGIKTLDNNGAWRQEPQNALPEGIDQVTAIALSEDNQMLVLGDQAGDIRILQYSEPTQKVLAKVKEAAQLFMRGKKSKS
ncbi:MAG: hypothetical protein P4L31_03280, partial [Candidatus Babeliales bacterium]|nr:hypothetical protein [Candidatus Babeliales bacterium]